MAPTSPGWSALSACRYSERSICPGRGNTLAVSSPLSLRNLIATPGMVPMDINWVGQVDTINSLLLNLERNAHNTRCGWYRLIIYTNTNKGRRRDPHHDRSAVSEWTEPGRPLAA